MADAIAESMSTGLAVRAALEAAAGTHGRSLGAQAGITASREDALAAASRVLAANGYEPRTETTGLGPDAAERVIMTNCPFHSLTHSHGPLVCEMNHALLTGLTDSIAPGRLIATLDPAEGRCCVVLTAAAADAEARRH